ncbi:MAG TPA: hypothetical protein VK656_04190 [Candidatus Acidoferrum sp.]|nr:hypothetical protein [Candidatus Acidoferrum sp.]
MSILMGTSADLEPEPVLVLHGVANRDAAEYERTVQRLEAAVNAHALPGTARYRLIPVFWGDLQPDYGGLWYTLPQPPGIQAMPPTDQHLPPQSIGALHEGLGFLEGVGLPHMGHRDAERLTYQARRTLLAPGENVIGDVLVYMGNRTPIQRRIRERLADAAPGWGTAERPISVLAHSLGGLISFDSACATEPPVHIRNLATFGSAVATFHILDPRQEVNLATGVLTSSVLAAFKPGAPIRLPATLGSWTNIWHAMDPLAFLAGNVFRLNDSSTPVDRMIEGASDGWRHAHTSYWTHADVPALLFEALRRT